MGLLNHVHYIVYDTETLKILYTSVFYTKEFDNRVYEYRDGLYNSKVKKDGVNWINVTHPRHQEILKKINTVNSTCYGKGEQK